MVILIVTTAIRRRRQHPYHNDEQKKKANSRWDALPARIPSHLGMTTRLRVGCFVRCWGEGTVSTFDKKRRSSRSLLGYGQCRCNPQVVNEYCQHNTPIKKPRAVFRNLGKGVFEETNQEAGRVVCFCFCSGTDRTL